MLEAFTIYMGDWKMIEYKIEDHASSFLPEHKKWKLVWSDEFDGDKLDESKWGFREYFWGKKSPTFTREGVYVDGESNLHMAMVKKGDDYFSAQLQTGAVVYDLPKDSKGFWPFGKFEKPKFMHKFGYYECRCKLPKNNGWHAAFWLQAPGIGSHPDPKYGGVEVDIMENYRQAKEGNIICGWGGYGKDSEWFGHVAFPYVETEDGWHTYAVDWSEEGYVFYADGKVVSRQMAPKCAVSHVDEFILLTTECHGYNRIFGNESASAGLAGDASVWNGKPVEALRNAVLPDEFIVDYVRVFDSAE